MKKWPCILFFVLAVLLVHTQGTAQTTTFSFTARDGAGAVITNQPVTVRLTMHHDAPDGRVIFIEDHQVTTGPDGVVTVTMGQGKAVESKADDVIGVNALYFLETALSTDGKSFRTINTAQWKKYRFKAVLTDVFDISKLPDEMALVRTKLQTMPTMYLERYIASGSSFSRETMYHVFLQSDTILSMDIPGAEGFQLILNPGAVRGTLSKTDMTLRYSAGWDIGSYDIWNMPRTFRGYFDLLMHMTYTDTTQLLANYIGEVFGFEEEFPEDIFVEEFNKKYQPKTPLKPVWKEAEMMGYPDDTRDSVMKRLMAQLEGYDIVELVYRDYILADNYGAPEHKLIWLFYGNNTGHTLRDIGRSVTPEYYMSVRDTVAILIPRHILLPLNSKGAWVKDTAVLSQLLFHARNFNWSNTDGFYLYQMLYNQLSPSVLAGTGLVLTDAQVKLDIWSKHEFKDSWKYASLPPNFKGFAIEEGTVNLPTVWQPMADSPKLKLNKLRVHVDTGLSGSVKLEGDQPLVYTNTAGERLELTVFEVVFTDNKVTTCNIQGTLQSPKKKDKPEPVRIELTPAFKIVPAE